MRTRANSRGAEVYRIRARSVWALGLCLAMLVSPALGERTKLKPGWNLYSSQQDVELGREVARDAETKLPLLNDRKVDDYINRLGLKLASRAQGERYPYQFKTVNDKSINAFALPGGFIYVNRGVIESSDTEAQLAGVIGHEIGHVALRHGTNQASKSTAFQGGLGILGGILGGGSTASILSQVGAGFALNSVLLKYGRDAERQSDLIGTQILYDLRYDPRAMAQFFEKLEAQEKGGRPPDFFSSHPSPDRRRAKIMDEVERLGGPPRNYRDDTAEFREIKRYLVSLPAPAAKGTEAEPKPKRVPRPKKPSSRHLYYQGESVKLRFPRNWQSSGEGNSFSLAPAGGIIENEKGRGELAYGMLAAIFEPEYRHRRSITLEVANDQLIYQLQKGNPHMRVVRDHGERRVGGQSALLTELVNQSVLGGREINWLVTVLRPDGLSYFAFVAPEAEFADYRRAFESIIRSIRFK